jgi:excinuclease ABC subunit A
LRLAMLTFADSANEVMKKLSMDDTEALLASPLETDLVDPTVIAIKGARVNNLKNVELTIPKNQLVVVTGVSGSGKSSITMDTLYAEGQRRYVESLSAYARQFLGRMKKPDVDYIRGICPAIAIEQRVTGGNNRSTVGSMTELNDFLRLLFARVGKMYSPISGNEVLKHEVTDVINLLKAQPEGTKGYILAPLNKRAADRKLKDELGFLLQKGFTRIAYQGEVLQIEEVLESKKLDLKKPISDWREKGLQLLVDRFAVRHEDDQEWMRLADSVSVSFAESDGDCVVQILGDKPILAEFNNRFELDGMVFPEPTPQLFNYNNPYGACPTCEGFGKVLGIDHDKVIPDKSLSVYDGAVQVWKGEKFGLGLEDLLKHAHKFDFPVHTAVQDLSKSQYKLLWTGNEHFEGLNAFFTELESKTYKIQNRVTLARYRGRTSCATCEGGRLRKEALCVRIHGQNIADVMSLPIAEIHDYFEGLKLTVQEEAVGKRIIAEIRNRLRVMVDLGLGYLTLDRISNTLSGGETQRIHLTRTLSSNLTSSMYILDEPSIGLHPRDTGRMTQVLLHLRDLGNSVVVVEHEEEVIKAADFLVDMGPEAGVFGGELVYAGPYADIFKKAPKSLTTEYLTGVRKIALPAKRRKPLQFITIKRARLHNLKQLDVRIPLQCFTVVSGVSGSGKSTLVRDILYPALLEFTPGGSGKSPTGAFDGIEGPVKQITTVEFINQQPIGKSSRSNPVTYVKAYDYIRDLYADQPGSRQRGFQAKHFSFNVEGGRCETCKGEGEQVVEMQFLADVHLTCEECKGKRFRSEVLDVAYKGKNIFNVLEMSVDEAVDFFAQQKDVLKRIKPLQEVGLGYIKLGQSSSVLSGGEAQRVKLASYLINEQLSGQVFFIFDEPTTGLHFHDIDKLLKAFQALVDRGHTVLVVEHNMEVIKSADWIVELGPEGGKHGGNLVFEGAPEDLIKVKDSPTAPYLKEKLANK